MSNLVERLRAYAPFRLGESEWFGPKVCADAAAHIEAQEAEISRLRSALEFYGDESGWNEPPVQTVKHEIFGQAYQNQASKIRQDRGKIARAALSPVLIEDGKS